MANSENKCIITKFQGIINDPNLVTPDEIRISMYSGAGSASVDKNFTFSLSTKGPVKLRVLGGHLYSGPERTDVQEIGSSEDYDFNSGGLTTFYARRSENEYDFKLAIFGKQNIYKWSTNALVFPLEQVKYCTELAPVSIAFAGGKLSDVKNVSTSELSSLTFEGSFKDDFDAEAKAVVNSATAIVSYADIGYPTGTNGFLDPSGSVKVYSCFNPNTYDLSMFAGYQTLACVTQNARGNSTWSATNLRQSTYPLVLKSVMFASTGDIDSYLQNMAALSEDPNHPFPYNNPVGGISSQRQIYIAAPSYPEPSGATMTAINTLLTNGFGVKIGDHTFELNS